MRTLLFALALLLVGCAKPADEVSDYLQQVEQDAQTPWVKAYLRSLRDPRVAGGIAPLPDDLVAELNRRGADVRPGDTLPEARARLRDRDLLGELGAPPTKRPWGEPEVAALVAAPTPASAYGKIVRLSQVALITRGGKVAPSYAIPLFIEGLAEADGAIVAMAVAHVLGHPAANDHNVQLALVDAVEKAPSPMVRGLAGLALTKVTGQRFPLSDERPDLQDPQRWRDYLAGRP